MRRLGGAQSETTRYAATACVSFQMDRHDRHHQSIEFSAQVGHSSQSADKSSSDACDACEAGVAGVAGVESEPCMLLDASKGRRRVTTTTRGEASTVSPYHQS